MKQEEQEEGDVILVGGVRAGVLQHEAHTDNIPRLIPLLSHTTLYLHTTHTPPSHLQQLSLVCSA